MGNLQKDRQDNCFAMATNCILSSPFNSATSSWTMHTGGIFKMLQRLLKQFWWSRVRTNINAYLSSFHDCCWPKATIANSATLFHLLPSPEDLWNTELYYCFFRSAKLHDHFGGSAPVYQDGSFYSMQSICSGDSTTLFQTIFFI